MSFFLVATFAITLAAQAPFLAMPREARAADKSLKIPYEAGQDVLGTLWQLQPVQRTSARAQ